MKHITLELIVCIALIVFSIVEGSNIINRISLISLNNITVSK
jgi:hypothetical protein